MQQHSILTNTCPCTLDEQLACIPSTCCSDHAPPASRACILSIHDHASNTSRDFPFQHAYSSITACTFYFEFIYPQHPSFSCPLHSFSRTTFLCVCHPPSSTSSKPQLHTLQFHTYSLSSLRTLYLFIYTLTLYAFHSS